VSFLLDTNVVSDLRRSGRLHQALHAWFADQSTAELYLSVVTVGEIREGIERIRRRDSRQAQTLGRWLDDLLRFYGERLIAVDGVVADEWGRLRSVRTLPVIDALLAATARVHNLTLVTRNDKDFAGLGVTVLNPY
jgi:predicted nucleic acid-binding protein